MGIKLGFVLFVGLAVFSTISHAQSTGHCQRYQNCIYETRQHYIACLGGIGTAILLDNANNLEAHRLLAYHDNWKATCLKESSNMDEIEFTRRAARRHQSMMECFGKPYLLANTNLTEEKHLTCSGMQTELSGFGSVFQTAAEPNECSMIYRRVLTRCDILADCCPQFDECSKRNQHQYFNQYYHERQMATHMLDCLKEGPKFAKDLPSHIAGPKGEKEISFKDLPPEVQNELIQNSFDRRHSPQNDAAPPAPITITDAAPPAPASPPGPRSSSWTPVSSPSTLAASDSKSSTTSEPVPPPTKNAEFDPVGDFLKKHSKSSELEKVTKSTTTTTAAPSTTAAIAVAFDPVKQFLDKHPTALTTKEVRRSATEKKPSTTTTATTTTTKTTSPPTPFVPTLPPLPTLAPLPGIPTLPPPEKAWNDLVHLFFPGAPTPATTTPSAPTTTTLDPIAVAKKKKEREVMDRKMRFLNQFYCSEYMKCEDIVNEEYDKCEQNHANDHDQYGIPNTKLREELFKNSNASAEGITAACLGFIDDATVKEFNSYQNETHKIDNECTSKSNFTVLPMTVIERCDGSLHYKPEVRNETEEAPKNLNECIVRAKEIEARCKAIRSCCPQHGICVNAPATGAKERLRKLWAQLKMEQSDCEATMAQTIEKHHRRLDKFKFKYLYQ
ncbi:hypothetical protein QR680_000698 [Steinernema hermaphroditum]|uniref:Uncharacterized protein n=1 Tax=Steinernema hermaphroditum TaxID=289476 RepID=A0AA39GWD7_9BILA|nr:hypothetical protein QR680_000698 [Steinernema hermaphroditum]